MKIHLARAGYARRVSDGNYGSEEAQAFLEAIVDSEEEVSDVQHDLMELCRYYVREILRQSDNKHVRGAVAPRPAEETDTPF
jgi:hypothetical protein